MYMYTWGSNLQVYCIFTRACLMFYCCCREVGRRLYGECPPPPFMLCTQETEQHPCRGTQYIHSVVFRDGMMVENLFVHSRIHTTV